MISSQIHWKCLESRIAKCSRLKCLCLFSVSYRIVDKTKFQCNRKRELSAAIYEKSIYWQTNLTTSNIWIDANKKNRFSQSHTRDIAENGMQNPKAMISCEYPVTCFFFFSIFAFISDHQLNCMAYAYTCAYSMHHTKRSLRNNGLEIITNWTWKKKHTNLSHKLNSNEFRTV